MAKKVAAVARIEPTLTPQRAIELLRRQIEELERVSKLDSRNPEVSQWQATTEAVLKNAFGYPSDLVDKFKYSYGAVLLNMSDAHYQREC